MMLNLIKLVVCETLYQLEEEVDFAYILSLGVI